MQMMLARGLVPLQPVLQLCALYQLSVIGSPTVVQEAKRSVLKMPARSVAQLAQEPLLASILDWMEELYGAQIHRELLQNRRCPLETLERIARSADEGACEVLLRNEQLLLKRPGLIELLYLNPRLRPSSADRMLELAARHGLKLEGIPFYEEILQSLKEEKGSTPEAQRAADEVFKELVAERESEENAEISKRESPPPLHTQREKELPKAQSATALILQMNVAQRVRLASMGSKSERAVLIRDGNKVVSRAVIRSPAVTDSEAVSYARIKSLNEEIVTFIAHNRKWTRNYQMRLALISHPKTPVAIALRFLTQLRISDLKMVARSHGIPGPVVSRARQMLKKRMGG